VQAAAAFNQPLLARVAQPGKRVAPDKGIIRPQLSGASTIQFSGFKRAHEGNGVVVRLYESGGRAGQATLSGLPEKARVWETNILEDPLKELDVRNGVVSLAFSPWHVKTLLIEST
jgi:alpha-mannosidase